jgi:hypothetical protein
MLLVHHHRLPQRVRIRDLETLMEGLVVLVCSGLGIPSSQGMDLVETFIELELFGSTAIVASPWWMSSGCGRRQARLEAENMLGAVGSMRPFIGMACRLRLTSVGTALLPHPQQPLAQWQLVLQP